MACRGLIQNRKVVVRTAAGGFLGRMELEASDPPLDFAAQLERYIVYLVEHGQHAPRERSAVIWTMMI